MRGRQFGPADVRGGDQEHEVLADARQAAQQVLPLLAHQLVVGHPHGAVAAQPLPREPGIRVAQDRQEPRQPAQPLGEQVDAAQVGRFGAGLREVGQGGFDGGHAPQGFPRGAGLGLGLGGRAEELDNAQPLRPEDAHRGVDEVGAGVVEAAQRGPLFAQHVGIVADLDGQVGQLSERDRAEEAAPRPIGEVQPLVQHAAIVHLEAVVYDREFHRFPFVGRLIRWHAHALQRLNVLTLSLRAGRAGCASAASTGRPARRWPGSPGR